jgi:biopolymer transport protein ExbD
MGRFRRRGWKLENDGDVMVDLLPLMSVFIALIPMLLLSAVFLEMAVIPMNLPSGAPDAPVAPPQRAPLGLSVIILDEAFAIEATGVPRRVVVRANDGVEAELASVLQGFAETYPDNKDVVIGSGPHVRYKNLIDVMDVAREAGLANISLLGTAAL